MGVKKVERKAATVGVVLVHGKRHRFQGHNLVAGVVYEAEQEVAEYLLGTVISGIEKFAQAGLKHKGFPTVKLPVSFKGLEFKDEDAEIAAHVAKEAEEAAKLAAAGTESGDQNTQDGGDDKAGAVQL